MPPVTIDKIAHELLLHCPLAGKPLATLWAANAFARLADLYDRWSWRLKYAQFLIPDVYNTGTISVASTDPTLVTGTGTTWTAAMVGRQMRMADTYGFGFDIIEFVDSTHVRISQPWLDADLTNAAYSIVQQFVTVPDDFAAFISVLDPTQNHQLRTGVERREIDRRDVRRTSTGNPYVLAEAGYAPAFLGSVDVTPFQARGSGPSPVFGGAYSGAVDTLFIVEITTGGVVGTAVYQWKRGTGSYVTGAVTSSNSEFLAQDVTIAFPAATYVAGNVFVARAVASSSFGLTRFEMWPTQTVRTVYPYYYLALPPDVSSSPLTLPRSIRGDVILKGALAEAAAWAGRGAEQNPLYDLKAAAKNLAEFERMIDILTLRDDDLFPRNVTYATQLPFAGPPWDSEWEQRHA
jgi:hypothetical protein